MAIKLSFQGKPMSPCKQGKTGQTKLLTIRGTFPICLGQNMGTGITWASEWPCLALLQEVVATPTGSREGHIPKQYSSPGYP